MEVKPCIWIRQHLHTCLHTFKQDCLQVFGCCHNAVLSYIVLFHKEDSDTVFYKCTFHFLFSFVPSHFLPDAATLKWSSTPPVSFDSTPSILVHHWSVDLVTYLRPNNQRACKTWLLLPQTGKVYKPLAICRLLLVAVGGALVSVSEPCLMHCSHLTQFIAVGVSLWQWYIPPVILLMYNHSAL